MANSADMVRSLPPDLVFTVGKCSLVANALCLKKHITISCTLFDIMMHVPIPSLKRIMVGMLVRKAQIQWNFNGSNTLGL